jgi:membrane protease YdiL (CAAX protease family)
VNRLRDPESGLSYPEALQDGSQTVPQQSMSGVVGTLLAMLTYLVSVPVAAFLFNQIAWRIAGSPGDFASYSSAAQAMETPVGMFTRHLATSLLIGIAILAVMAYHRVRVRWLFSVQPGFRWRFALLVFAVSLVVMNLVALADMGFQVTVDPQPDFGWFLLVILITTPFQAAAEEIFFRGYLVQALTLITRNKWVGVVLCAAIFAFFHAGADPLMFGYRFGFGVLAGALVIYTGGLEAAIAAHLVNNLCSFVYAALGSSVAAAMAVESITLPQLVLPLAGFAVCGLAAVFIGRKLQVATVTP